MPLTSKQRAALEAKAKEKGVDAAKLIAAAEALQDDGGPAAASGKAKPVGEAAVKPNLYMYHLPFVTVNEVRTLWLDLDPVAGGDEYAGVWAAKQGGTPSGETDQ
jgi:hypothetical protein